MQLQFSDLLIDATVSSQYISFGPECFNNLLEQMYSKNQLSASKIVRVIGILHELLINLNCCYFVTSHKFVTG